jgi:nucleoside-diphosphate-sugar epimerase
MLRILITGGSGFLGSVLGKILSAKHEVHSARLNAEAPPWGLPVQFDIQDAELVARALRGCVPTVLSIQPH